MQSCTLGVADALKCGAREDLACQRLDSDIGFCTGVCTTHAQCSGSCSSRTGSCTSEAPEPVDDFGQACDPDVPESCSGVCVEVEPGYAVCSNPCVFGSATPCALDTAIPSLCAIVTTGGSIGDLGYCAELCDCNDDCMHPQAICDPFTDPSVVELLGRAGVCAASVTGDGTERLGIACGG